MQPTFVAAVSAATLTTTATTSMERSVYNEGAKGNVSPALQPVVPFPDRAHGPSNSNRKAAMVTFVLSQIISSGSRTIPAPLRRTTFDHVAEISHFRKLDM